VIRYYGKTFRSNPKGRIKANLMLGGIKSIKYEQKTAGLKMPEKSRKQLRKAYRLKTYEQNF